MANRRMFDKTIVSSDSFLELSHSAQALYFQLSMDADDDGFINSPRKIVRMVGASEQDFQSLIDKKFLIEFPSGIVVIKHWRINNYIRADRKKETLYGEEFAQLTIKDNGGYKLTTNCQPLDNQQVDERSHRLDKYSIDKNRIDKNSITTDDIYEGLFEDDDFEKRLLQEGYVEITRKGN